MTEKQRWLLRDLEAWREKQLAKVGKYRARRKVVVPPQVRQALKAQAQAIKTLRAWDAVKDTAWNRDRAAIEQQVTAVKRVILFEKTETALKALRALK